MRTRLYIERLVIAVVLLLLLALAPAMAQTVVYSGQTTPLAVEQTGFDTYKWELYNDGTVNFATEPGNCPTTMADFDPAGGNAGASVNVKWTQPGIYFFKVTGYDVAGCASNLKVGIIEVKVSVKAEILPPTVAICPREPISLELILTGTAPWNFTYTAKDVDGVITTYTVDDVTTSAYTLIIDPGPTTTTEYTVTSISDSSATNTEPGNMVTQTVNPLPAPSKILHR